MNVVDSMQPELVVQNYFNQVEAIASRVKSRVPAHIDVQDLVQTGMIGLLEASEQFNPLREVEFSTYANSRITGAILDEMKRWDSCSLSDRKNGHAIEQAKKQLRKISGDEPNSEQIAEAVGLGLEEYDRNLCHRVGSYRHVSAARVSTMIQ
jgi:RNA polymerase sigma factor for flagellar operon FliA